MYNADEKQMPYGIIINYQEQKNDEIDELERLRGALEYERLLRQQAETELAQLRIEVDELRKVNKHKRLSKEEILKKNLEKVERMRTGIKKDGKPIAHAANSLRSYDDYIAIKNVLLKDKENGKRNAALFTIGISFGLRASDLLQLRWRDIFEDDFETFKDRVYIVEKKTGKVNSSCIMTEAVREAISSFMPKYKRKELTPSMYVFKSPRGYNQPITVDSVRKIINNAAAEAGLDFNIGSHGMRKTFACIVATIDKTTIPADAIVKVQAHLNHSDKRTTSSYIGALQYALDAEKQTVSDFLMGKTEKKDIAFDLTDNDAQLMEKLDTIIGMLEENKK